MDRTVCSWIAIFAPSRLSSSENIFENALNGTSALESDGMVFMTTLPGPAFVHSKHWQTPRLGSFGHSIVDVLQSTAVLLALYFNRGHEP